MNTLVTILDVLFLLVYIDTKYYQHSADGIDPERLYRAYKFLQYKNFTNFAEVLT